MMNKTAIENKYPTTTGYLVIKEGAYNSNKYYLKDSKTKTSGFANKDAKELLLLCNGTNNVGEIENILVRRYDNPKKEIVKRVRKSINYFKKLGVIKLSDKPLPKSSHFYRKKMKWSLDVVYMEITSSCNLSCIHCYANSGTNTHKDLDTKTVLKIIDKVSELGVLEIIITGGEPLIRKDIFKILKYIKTKNINFSLFTNGSLLDKSKIKKLKPLWPDVVAISIDSIDPKIHNYIRGSDCFSKTMKNIKLLIEEGIPVRINTTIFKGLNDKPKQIKELINCLMEMGVNSVVIGDLITYGRGKNIENLSPALKTAKTVTRLFSERARKIRHTGKKTPSLKLTDTFSGKKDYEGDKHSVCGIGTFSCIIKSNGEVALCPVLSDERHSTHNVLEKELKDVWPNSKIFKPFRNVTVDNIPKCKLCEKRYECLGGCKARALMYNKKFNSPDLWMCSSFGKYDT